MPERQPAEEAKLIGDTGIPMIRGAVDSHARSALSLVLSGLSVGWLVGLSVSPVLHLIV